MRLIFLVLCFTYINCDEPIPSLNGRIVGGEDIDIEQAPYQVSLQRSGKHICGGAIYSSEVIVTAAHCIRGTDPGEYSIRAGSSYVDRDGEVYTVKNFAKNPGFTQQNKNGDIAILRLSSPLEFSDKVASIELIGAGEEIPDGDLVTVTGWGRVEEEGSYPGVLQRVRLVKVSDSECAAAYEQFTSLMFCAGVPEGGKDACQGDSGGPLVYNNKLAGVVSFGRGCGRPGSPTVYTKISAMRTKISRIAEQLQLAVSSILKQ